MESKPETNALSMPMAVRVQAIRGRMVAACGRVGRDPREVLAEHWAPALKEIEEA